MVVVSTAHLGVELLDGVSLGESSLVSTELQWGKNGTKKGKGYLLSSWRICTSSSQCCCLQPSY